MNIILFNDKTIKHYDIHSSYEQLPRDEIIVIITALLELKTDMEGATFNYHEKEKDETDEYQVYMTKENNKLIIRDTKTHTRKEILENIYLKYNKFYLNIHC